MNKWTIVVVVAAAGALGYLFMKPGVGADAAGPQTLKGYLPEALQSEWQKRKDNPLLFLNEKEEDRKKQFQASPYDEIELSSSKFGTVTLKREGEDEWKMTAPVQSEVEAYRAKSMVELFATDTALTPAKHVANKEHLADFGLDEGRAVRVTLKEKGVTKISLAIGDRKKVEREGEEQGNDTYDTFVMLEGQPEEVYRAKQKDLRQPFDVEVGDLRSKKVFSFDLTDIAKVTIEDPSNTEHPKIVLSAVFEEPKKDEKAEPKPEGEDGKDDKKEEAKGSWTLVEPKVDGFKLSELRTYWSSIANLRAMEFVMGKKPEKETGLLDAAKVGKLTVELKKEGEKPVTILFGDVKEKDRSVYALIEGRDEYMVVADSTRKSLLKALAELREKNVLGVEKDEQVSRIEVTNQYTKDGPMVFVKTGDTWTMEKPVAQKPFDREVKNLVSAIRHFRATDFLAAAPTPEESGLDTPQVVVTATIDGQPRTLRFGAEKDSKVTATLDGSGLYFTVGSWTKNKFDKKVEDFRDKVVLNVEAADLAKLTLAHEGDAPETVELAQGADGKWTVTSPKALSGDTLNEPAVTGIANSLKALEVKEFTDKAAADAGLDKPVFTLTATLKDGTTRVVTVSGQMKDSDPYVSVGAPGVEPGAVFTLDQYRVKNLQKKLADLEK